MLKQKMAGVKPALHPGPNQTAEPWSNHHGSICAQSESIIFRLGTVISAKLAAADGHGEVEPLADTSRHLLYLNLHQHRCLHRDPSRGANLQRLAGKWMGGWKESTAIWNGVEETKIG